MSASFPRQACERQGTSSRTNRATSALRHEARTMRTRQGASRRLVPPLASEQRKAVLAHGRRTEPTPRSRRLEPPPQRASATHEHSTKHHCGEAGYEHYENPQQANRDGPPLATGRAARTDAGELLLSRTPLLRRICFSRVQRTRDRALPLPTCEPPNV